MACEQCLSAFYIGQAGQSVKEKKKDTNWTSKMAIEINERDFADDTELGILQQKTSKKDSNVNLLS